MRSKLIQRSLAATISGISALSGISFTPDSHAAGVCIQAAFAINHTIRNKASGTLESAVGGVNYEQQLANGSIRVLSSSVGFVTGTKTRVDAKGQGIASKFSVRGDITKVPRAAFVTGDFVLQNVPGRGNVPVHLELAARGLAKAGETSVNGQTSVKLSGKTSYVLSDAASGAVLSQGRPGALSPLRTFQHRWRRLSCGGGLKR